MEVLLIELTDRPSPWIAEALPCPPFRYLHCPCGDLFHKTKALNLGLAAARGDYGVPYDVDLLPVGETLSRQWAIAQHSDQLLITGYRLMSDRSSLTPEQMPAALEHSTTAPEDQPTALWKHLMRHEKFGVVPFFRRDRLLELGGWDERFIGWGAEDQDMIERYLQGGRSLCRCPELSYLHLFHAPDAHWSEPSLVQQNRHYYYSKTR